VVVAIIIGATEERRLPDAVVRRELWSPDLRDKIRAVDVPMPDDPRALNPNAVRGDPSGGSAEAILERRFAAVEKEQSI
jgi:hypothetical protein